LPVANNKRCWLRLYQLPVVAQVQILLSSSIMAAVPLLAPVATQVTSFAAKYADNSIDPYAGNYTAPMHPFCEGPMIAAATQIMQHVKALDPNQPLAFIGIFEYPGEECGRSMVFHSLSTFPSTFGVTSEWDNKSFAFVQEVTLGGEINSVEFTEDNFDHCLDNLVEINVPVTCDCMDEILMAAAPEAELFGPYADNDVTKRTFCTRCMMFLPAPYVPLVINRQLRPHQLYIELGGAIRADNKAVQCSALLGWLVMAMVREGATLPSPVCQPMPNMPFADAALLGHRRRVLYSQLPGLDASNIGLPTAHLAATQQLVTYVGNLVQGQLESRQAEEDRAQAAKERHEKANDPNLPREEQQDLICHMCAATDISSAPEIYHRLANAGKMTASLWRRS
jgi:hypothetical protein